MAYKRRSAAKKSQEGIQDRDYILHLLSLEYQALKEEALVRTSGRFQFLGLMTTAAALLTTGVFSSSIFKSQTWISAVLAAAVFGFGIICFIYVGRQRAIAFTKLTELEGRINGLVQAEPGYSVVLGANEVDRRNWTSYRKLRLLILGPRRMW